MNINIDTYKILRNQILVKIPFLSHVNFVDLSLIKFFNFWVGSHDTMLAPLHSHQKYGFG
jgi:hypothetical protein